MGVFKNGVGRPSNETIKKRRIFYGLIFAIVFIAIASITLVLDNKKVGEKKVVASVTTKYNGKEPKIIYSDNIVSIGNKVAAGKTVKLKITPLSPKKDYVYYYKYISYFGDQVETSSCNAFSGKFTYSHEMLKDNSYLIFGVYNDSSCSSLIKTYTSKKYKLKSEASKTLTATFNKNGATSIGNTKLTCKTTNGKCTVIAPSITRNNYIIGGWSLLKILPSSYKVGSKITLTKNRTFYAKTYKKTSKLKNISDVDNQVSVSITPDVSTTTVDYGKTINFKLGFTNKSNDKYYYKWYTYSNNESITNYEGKCTELKNNTSINVSLLMSTNDRSGKVVLYTDSNCENNSKDYKTLVYNPKSIPLPEASDEKDYYYSKLTSREKVIYRYLIFKKDDIINQNDFHFADLEKIDNIRNVTSKEVENARAALYSDRPEFYYIFSQVQFLYLNIPLLIDKRLYIKFNNQGNSSTIRNNLKKIDDVVNKIVNEAKKKKTQYEQAKYVNEYIVNNMTYKLDTAKSIDGFIIKTGQCMTYAFMYEYVLKKLNIPVIYVAAHLTTTDLHAWDHVKLDGKWYIVDTCWNNIEGHHTDYFMIGTNSKYAKTRITDDLKNYPTLSTTDYKK